MFETIFGLRFCDPHNVELVLEMQEELFYLVNMLDHWMVKITNEEQIKLLSYCFPCCRKPKEEIAAAPKVFSLCYYEGVDAFIAGEYGN